MYVTGIFQEKIFTEISRSSADLFNNEIVRFVIGKYNFPVVPYDLGRFRIILS